MPESWGCNFYMFTPGKIRQLISEVRNITVSHIKYFGHVPQSSMHRRPTGKSYSLDIAPRLLHCTQYYELLTPERATPLHLETKAFSKCPS